MRVVDTRDFCIPSDKNDYDELVAFADTMANIPQFDAVPIDVLDKIRAEIADMQIIGYATVDGKREIASRAVMRIIDKYRESEDT